MTQLHVYLLARHQLLLLEGIVFLGVGLIYTLTGKYLAKGKGIISRTDQPKAFRVTVFVCFLCGFSFLGLYLYAIM